MQQISVYYSCILQSLLNLFISSNSFGVETLGFSSFLFEFFFLLICKHSLHIKVTDPCLSNILQFFPKFVISLILIYGLVEVNKFKTLCSQN